MALGNWYPIHVVVRPLMIVGQVSNLALSATGMAPGPKTLLWSMIDRRLTAAVAPPAAVANAVSKVTSSLRNFGVKS